MDPVMLDRLPRRERQLVDALIALGEGTAEDIRGAMPDPPSNSAVRMMLSRLEDKGAVTRRAEGQRFVYVPTVPVEAARRTALKEVVGTYFGGSPASAATALLGMAEQLDEPELRRLEQLIARARTGREPT
jgi:predicted transcriptional regulator